MLTYQIYVYRNIKTSILGMLAHDYYIDYVLQPSTELIDENNRAKFCKKLSIDLMDNVASRLYVDKIMSKSSVLMTNALETINELFEYVQEISIVL